MTTDTELLAELGAEAAAEQRKHVASLHLIHQLREAQRASKREETRLVDALKQYLELEGMPELVDGEHALRARLQEREGWEQDLRGVHPAVLAELQTLGLLRFDNAAFDALKKAAPSETLDLVSRYRRRVVASVALLVEAVEK